jgi:hypothetical protein
MSDTAPSNDVRHVGRPSKFNEESVERLCAAIGDGMPIKGACVVAGIGVTTLNEWRERYPRLQERLSDAREHARLKALQAIKAAGERDWRAWDAWLKLTYPADYRGTRAKIEVSAFASANMLVISVEQQRAIQEQRQRLLKGESTP